MHSAMEIREDEESMIESSKGNMKKKSSKVNQNNINQ
jgi:hypothetical protein